MFCDHPIKQSMQRISFLCITIRTISVPVIFMSYFRGTWSIIKKLWFLKSKVQVNHMLLVSFVEIYMKERYSLVICCIQRLWFVFVTYSVKFENQFVTMSISCHSETDTKSDFENMIRSLRSGRKKSKYQNFKTFLHVLVHSC